MSKRDPNEITDIDQLIDLPIGTIIVAYVVGVGAAYTRFPNGWHGIHGQTSWVPEHLPARVVFRGADFAPPLRQVHPPVPQADDEVTLKEIASELNGLMDSLDDHVTCLLYTSPSPRD